MMRLRTTPPFRADHVGSLLRSPELLRARDAHAQGRLTASELRSVEDDAIREVVRMQESVGLQGITDGELRRSSWHMDFLYQLDGVARGTQKRQVRFRNDETTVEFAPSVLMVEGRLGLSKTIFGDDFSMLRSTIRTGTPKLTIPSPSMVHYRGSRAEIDPAVYPTLEEFLDDLVSVYADEVRRLAQLGCTYLQLDDTSFAYLNDESVRAAIAELGGDAEHQHLHNIRLINRVLAGRPDGMAVTIHTCRGNFRSSWSAEGDYEHVAEPFFNELDVDGFFLEYDDARSGGFEPLRFVPKGKQVVLGLVTSKRGALESKDELKRRVEEASRYVPLDQLCLSPQCGFSSTAEGNALTYDEQVAKLRLVVETADEVWG
jgi:5-methyltetrahydropteroyltriglutamate--homocysteine methyltransferase